MNSPRASRMAPIQRLPFELKEQIARELCDFDLFDQRNYRIDPSGDIFLNGHTYEWNPLPEAREKPQLSFQSVYDDLRALSLVSRDFRDPAQRALFSVVIVGEPTTYFKLFRSLLESPEIRSYIRCLMAVWVRNPDAEKLRHKIEESRCAAFVDILGHINFHSLHLRNEGYFRRLKRKTLQQGGPGCSPSEDNIFNTHPDLWVRELLAESLQGILELCPSLRAFHLYCSHLSREKQQNSSAFWGFGMGFKLFDACIELLKDRHLLTTLTVDLGAMFTAGIVSLARGITGSGRCPSSIEHLTMIGSLTFQHNYTMLDIDSVFSWLSDMPNLKTLRITNGFDNIAISEIHTWNHILLRFKATLEQLVMDGTWSLLQMTPSQIIGPWAYNQKYRCGPSGILACLPEMEKLRYLSVPIHYLRSCPEGKEPLEILIMPNEGHDVRQLVEADVKFPKSLERAEVMMVEQVQNNRITGVQSLRIDLGKDGHTTGEIVRLEE